MGTWASLILNEGWPRSSVIHNTFITVAVIVRLKLPYSRFHVGMNRSQRIYGGIGATLVNCCYNSTQSHSPHLSKSYNHDKVKDWPRQKFTLGQAAKAQRGAEVLLYSFFNLGARWGVWSTPRPGRFDAGKDLVPIAKEADLDGCGKSRSPPGFDPRAVQPAASRYTDCAIPAHDQHKCCYDVFTATLVPMPPSFVKSNIRVSVLECLSLCQESR